MSRPRVAIILICGTLVLWFYLSGQALQSIEVAFVFGLILGTLFGWWTGGWIVLRKIRRLGHQKVDSDYEKSTKELL